MFITIDELARRRVNGVLPDEKDRAEALIEDATAVIGGELEARGIATDWDEAPKPVKVMTIKVVLRVLDNPNGLASEQLGQYSYRRPTDLAKMGIFLDKSEVAILLRQLRKVAAGSSHTPLGVPPQDVRLHTWVGVPRDLP